MANPVPDRGRNRTRILFTNGELGTSDNYIAEYNINSHQGMAAVRKNVEAHSARTGKPAWAETRTDAVKMGQLEPRVIYGKKTK